MKTKTFTQKAIEEFEKEFDKWYHPEFSIWRYYDPVKDPKGITNEHDGRSEVLGTVRSFLSQKINEAQLEVLEKIRAEQRSLYTFDRFNGYLDQLKKQITEEKKKGSRKRFEAKDENT